MDAPVSLFALAAVALIGAGAAIYYEGSSRTG